VKIRGSHFRTKHTSRGIQQRRHGDADHYWIARLLAPGRPARSAQAVWIQPPSPMSPPNVCKVITPSAYTMSSTRDARRRASVSKRCWPRIADDVCTNACGDHCSSKRVSVHLGVREPCVHLPTGGVGGYVGSKLRRFGWSAGQSLPLVWNSLLHRRLVVSLRSLVLISVSI
jgi:hypothetical protein